MFKKFSKEQIKQRTAELAHITEKVKEKRAETAGKPREGSMTLHCLLGSVQKEQKTKTAGKKDPPRHFIAIVKGVTDTITIEHRDHVNISRIKKIQKDTKSTTPDLDEELQLAQNTILGTSILKNGSAIDISTFYKINWDELKAFQEITCIGFEGDYAIIDGVEYKSFSCIQVIPKTNYLSLYQHLSQEINLEQLPIAKPNPLQKYGNPYILYVNDTFRENKEEGPVVSQNYVDIKEIDCKWQKQGETSFNMILRFGLWQKQDDAGYCVLGDIYEVDILNNAFGIIDIDLFSKIMPANKVPFVCCGQTNMKKTKIDPDNHDHTVGVYVNNAEFFLREYLLAKCPKVTFAYVKKELQAKPNDENAYIKRDIPNKPSKLNQNNLDANSNFINNKVVNASSYTGFLKDLNDQGCEWRVMHSTPDASIDMPEEELAKIPFKVIYAVMPFSQNEEQDEEEEGSLYEEETNQNNKRARDVTK